jgi:hypothetical protein
MHTLAVYSIRVATCLSAADHAWFEDLTICDPHDMETVLLTPAIDQTALHGILAVLRDLAIPLLAVQRVTTPQEGKCP